MTIYPKSITCPLEALGAAFAYGAGAFAGSG